MRLGEISLGESIPDCGKRKTEFDFSNSVL
jgi:hypothetical protein